MEEQTHNLDVFIFGIKGEQVTLLHVTTVEELTRIVLKFNSIMQWSVDDMDDNGVGVSMIGTGVIPEDVIDIYGMENIRLSRGAGYNC